MKTHQNYRRSGFVKLATALLCLSLIMLPCQRAPAPLTEMEAAVATCVIALACITGVAILVQECQPKASMFWYRVDGGPRVYVCLTCADPTPFGIAYNFCRGPFGTVAYCNEHAWEANNIWAGDDHCGPRARSPIRKRASLNKSTDGGKTWMGAKSVESNVDDNPGFVIMFPGTVLDTNAFSGLTWLQQEIVANPTNHVTVGDSAALFVISSVIVDDSTNAPVSVKAYDAGRMMKDGFLK